MITNLCFWAVSDAADRPRIYFFSWPIENLCLRAKINDNCWALRGGQRPPRPTITEKHKKILNILLLQTDHIFLVTLPFPTPPLPHQFHYQRLSKYFDKFNLNQYLINNVALQDYLIARISHVTNLLIWLFKLCILNM